MKLVEFYINVIKSLQMEVDNDYKERYAKILEEYDPENVVDTAFTFNGWQF